MLDLTANAHAEDKDVLSLSLCANFIPGDLVTGDSHHSFDEYLRVSKCDSRCVRQANRVLLYVAAHVWYCLPGPLFRLCLCI